MRQIECNKDCERTKLLVFYLLYIDKIKIQTNYMWTGLPALGQVAMKGIKSDGVCLTTSHQMAMLVNPDPSGHKIGC